jgi:hypothetical protein
MRTSLFVAFALLWTASVPALATVFATVRGVVHDPQHRPISGAQINLKAVDSAFAQHAISGPDGQFHLPQAPIGIYRLQVDASGFTSFSQTISLSSGSNRVLHIVMPIAQAVESVLVTASGETSSATDSSTPTTLITRQDIAETPGASRTLGMQMITDYVPGAYMTHDMLHMRGGHQTSWLIDGVSIPNTKIASNVGPQIDPKDIDQLETQRGSYDADLGDRTSGIFNVLPRNGFDFNHSGELFLYAENPYSAETQLSFGNHSAKTAWYASLTGSRSNYGLATPEPSIHHDATNSESAFASLIRNQSPQDQFRIDAQYRHDFFQVPYDPDRNDYECASGYYCSAGLRDVQTEDDSFVIFNWIHTISPKSLFDLAPFYHFNRADYDSPASDNPVATTWHQKSNYAGTQADVHTDLGPNSLSAGVYAFFQAENDIFGDRVNDGSGPSLPNAGSDANAGLVELYVTDHLHVGRFITLLGGERFSIYRAELNENAIYPRIGATIEIPRLHWVLRGSYGHSFQPAPVQTVSTSVLEFAKSLGGGEDTFTPLPSERDEEHQFGIHIPYRGWALDVDTFKNRVNNFLDHSNLGESNMYFPIAVDGALVRAWEMTLRSPLIAHWGQFHLSYANQIAEQRGNIIGGFTCGIPGDIACNLGPGYVPVDHDQRDTLNTGFVVNLPAHTWFSSNVYYGSGFTNGLADSGQGIYQAAYLPGHTTFDIAAGHHFGEHFEFTGSILNVSNHRVLLDNSITIGGFHWNDPRVVAGGLRYGFHF